jgi:tetratricopeptide (TPR) repeat protein
MPENELEIAFQKHSAGNLAEAEAGYRRYLKDNPNSAPALHFLGVLVGQQGNSRGAIELIGKAISINSRVPDFHSNLAMAYNESGEHDKAIVCCERSLALKPENPEALNHLGNALKQLGKVEDSIECYQRAIALKPDFLLAMSNLADSFRRLGRGGEAEKMDERVLARKPNDATALRPRAESLLRQNKSNDALAIFRRIISASPGDWFGYNGAGVALAQQQKLDDAIEMYQKAIELSPENPGPWNNLGHARITQGKIDEGMESYQKALALRPDFADTHNNLANAYLSRLDLEKAMAEYEAAMFFRPDHADAHWNRSLLLLLQGDYPRGWLEYEWRWLKFPQFRRQFPQPMWDGGDISGKTILVHAEQGFGDTFQFIRLAPMVAERGATVNLECQRELSALLQHVPGIARTVSRGDPLPPFDVHCPLLSVPHALRLSPEQVSAKVPYLSVDDNLRKRWERRLEPQAKKFKVGIVWAGATIHPKDAERSMELKRFTPLAGIENVAIFSLQKASGRAVENVDFEVIDHTHELHDFADTAALILNLDLVIGVDTSVVHLAGALGRPVWTLLPFSPDWRWLLGREDSPWYPTMRLFRQSRVGDWEGVMRAAGEALRESVESGK